MTKIHKNLPTAQIALTIDYELFGDGTGSVTEEQCIPTDYLASIVEIYGGKITIFVEVGQQIYFNKHGLSDQATHVENQIRNLYNRGHDIQLHIHPMWFFAPPPFNGAIQLDSALYDLSRLKPEEIDSIVSQSIEYLRSVIAPIDPCYSPCAYRAGAWSMENADILFAILSKHGIKLDSTVAPGAHSIDGSYGHFDFRRFAMQTAWRYGPLLELPILTEIAPFSAFRYINYWGVMTRRLVGRRYKTRLTDRNKNWLDRLWSTMKRNYYMADINFISPKTLSRMVEKQVHKNKELEKVPIILIGHSKSTYYADRLHDFFHELSRINIKYEICTLKDCDTRFLE